MQKDFSPAADADSIDDMADDMIEMTDEEGNTTLFKVLDYFFYNGDDRRRPRGLLRDEDRAHDG